MKAHSRGPRCPPWSLKAFPKRVGVHHSEWNHLGQLALKPPWEQADLKHGGTSKWRGGVWSSLVVLVTTQAQVVPTHAIITHYGQHLPPHSLPWTLSLLPNMGGAAFSAERVPEGPQMLNWGVKGICVLEGWSWEIQGASDSRVRICQLPVAT